MPYFYLCLSVFMTAASSVFGKAFNKRCDGTRDAAAFYNIFQAAAALLCWGVLFALNPVFDAGVLIYGVLFGICFTVCNIGNINALKYGPATLTSLFVSLSLIVTTLWGFVFWGSDVTVPVTVGLILVTVSLYLCLKTDRRDEKGFSFKWLFYALLALFGYAGCSVVQRTQQLRYNGEYGYLMMLTAIAFSTVVFLIWYLKSDKSDLRLMLRRCGCYPIFAGICNVTLNMCVMLMAVTELSPSLIYPVIAVGGLMVVTLFALFVFREKLNKWQWFGIFIGAIAVALLSI